MTAVVERTPLYDAHVRAGATMVDFHGWEMPVRYGQIPLEHQQVRLFGGLFDLCHMGRLMVTGPDGPAWIQSVLTNDVESMRTGDARYSLIVNENGGILDDLIAYRLHDGILLVVNASNREKVISWMQDHRPGGIEATLTDLTCQWAMVSVQGPHSVSILDSLVQLMDASNWELMDYYKISRARILGKEGLISRTGYTGEDGFEIYYPAEIATEFWLAVLECGGSRVAPIGLGARDTLRLEAGMSLYGNELDESVNPYEAGLGFAVKLKKATPFVGQEALRVVKQRGVSRRLVGFSVNSRRVARQGMTLYRGDEAVGTVTSGIPSPTLKIPIALGYLDSRVTGPDGLTVDIRGQRARVVPEPLPFFSRTRKRRERAL